MTALFLIRRHLVGGVLLAGVLASGAGLHHHEDLSGFLRSGSAGASTDHVVSSHSPLSRASHWHSGVRVKDDPCLACHVHRPAALARVAVGVVAALTGFLAGPGQPSAVASAPWISKSPRGPPCLS